MVLLGSLASVVVTSVIEETTGASRGNRVLWAGKLVYSFVITLSTSLLTVFIGRVSISIVANSLGELSLKK